MTAIFSRGVLPALVGSIMIATSACTDEDVVSQGDCIAFTVSVGKEWNEGKTPRSASSRPSDTVVPLQGCSEHVSLSLHTLYREAEGGIQNTFVSRAAPVEDSEFYDAFGLLACTYTGTWDASTARPDFLYNLKVRKDEGYNTHYYYPNNKNLYFYAYAPFQAMGVTLSAEDSQTAPTLTYTVPSAVADQKDLMLAKTDNTDLAFCHALTAVRFVCGVGMSEGTIQAVRLKNIYSKATCSFDSQMWSDHEEIKNFELTKLAVGTSPADEATDNYPVITDDAQTFMMLPQTLSADACIEIDFTYEGETEMQTLSASIGGTVWEKGMTVTYKISVDPYHESVDLGLSVRWATMNIGAISPGDFGDYFYRGATVADSEPAEDADIKKTLPPESDAATVNWGKKWHIPTKEECQELLDDCTWVKKTAENSGYGVAGYLVTSNVEGYTDKSIFLPSAGCEGHWGNYTIMAYWTSTYEKGHVYMGNHNILDTLYDSVKIIDTDWIGNLCLSVRPVKVKPKSD